MGTIQPSDITRKTERGTGRQDDFAELKGTFNNEVIEGLQRTGNTYQRPAPFNSSGKKDPVKMHNTMFLEGSGNVISGGSDINSISLNNGQNNRVTFSNARSDDKQYDRDGYQNCVYLDDKIGIQHKGGNTIDASRGGSLRVSVGSLGNTIIGSPQNDLVIIGHRTKSDTNTKGNDVNMGDGDDKVYFDLTFQNPEELRKYLKNNPLSGGKGNDTLSFQSNFDTKVHKMDDYLKVIKENTTGFENVEMAYPQQTLKLP
jgi:hypothetical protein